jgi:hypothetical protein
MLGVETLVTKVAVVAPTSFTPVSDFELKAMLEPVVVILGVETLVEATKVEAVQFPTFQLPSLAPVVLSTLHQLLPLSYLN